MFVVAQFDNCDLRISKQTLRLTVLIGKPIFDCEIKRFFARSCIAYIVDGSEAWRFPL